MTRLEARTVDDDRALRRKPHVVRRAIAPTEGRIDGEGLARVGAAKQCEGVATHALGHRERALGDEADDVRQPAVPGMGG